MNISGKESFFPVEGFFVNSRESNFFEKMVRGII